MLYISYGPKFGYAPKQRTLQNSKWNIIVDVWVLDLNDLHWQFLNIFDPCTSYTMFIVLSLKFWLESMNISERVFSHIYIAHHTYYSNTYKINK